jgi:rare lipoprotein A
MANGEPFDSRGLTAASPTLPLDSWIRVVNLRNGRSVEVQVTDRGPNKRLRGRVLDLSEAAAKRLGFEHDGLTRITFVPIAEPKDGKR